MKRSLFAIIIAAIVLVGCAQLKVNDGEAAPRELDFADASSGVAAPSIAVEMPAADSGVAYAPEAQMAQDTVANGFASGDRLVIMNASLSIVVDDPASTVDAITQLTKSMGGFVVSLNTYETYYGPESKPAQQASLTIRVPSEKLDEAMRQIKGMAVEVKSENMSGQDVTAEYTDLKSRLKNLEAAEKQLQSIMEEATKTEDVLAVYNQLVYTREQIEVIKGQMKYYEESATFSAITLDIIPNIVTQPIEVGGWHPEGAAKQAIEDTVRFLQNMTDSLIYFSIARLPFLVIVGVPAFLIGRVVWKRMKKNAPKPATVGAD
ncbi:MAG TPA: DUF4349 domain-containing protein [Anaerolineales bacterium]|nr:DUF4349 domain-containing protein [Anaerolineales bacterium]HLB49636.1 DUF4349 domain-containing protein [Anaerolineales bacterium]